MTTDYRKLGEIANRLAKIRGYSGLSSIDDPLLREWILTHAFKQIGKDETMEDHVDSIVSEILKKHEIDPQLYGKSLLSAIHDAMVEAYLTGAFDNAPIHKEITEHER